MVEPEAEEVEEQPHANLLPLMTGNIRGEDFVVSADHAANALYVQYEGWVVSYDIPDLIEESYHAVYGVRPEDFDLDLDGDSDG